MPVYRSRSFPRSFWRKRMPKVSFRALELRSGATLSLRDQVAYHERPSGVRPRHTFGVSLNPTRRPIACPTRSGCGLGEHQRGGRVRHGALRLCRVRQRPGRVPMVGVPREAATSAGYFFPSPQCLRLASQCGGRTEPPSAGNQSDRHEAPTGPAGTGAAHRADHDPPARMSDDGGCVRRWSRYFP